MIRDLYARLREAWPVNRVVAALTPIVFVPLAGFVSSWTADNFPGLPPMDENWLAGIFVAGAVSALAAAYKWLDGWQNYEALGRLPEVFPADDDIDLSQPDDETHPDDALLEDDPEMDDPEIPRNPIR